VETADKDRFFLFWLTQAWDDYLNGFLPLLPVLLLQAAVVHGSYYLIYRFHSIYPALPYMLFVVTPVSVGAALVYITVARGGRARLRDLFGAFPVYHRALVVSIGLACLTFCGVLAFVLPGVILYLTYFFSEYAVVDRRTGIKESFRLSQALTTGWKWRLLPLLLLSVLINLYVPNIVYVSGSITAPVVGLDLAPWTITGEVLKSLVFLPWLGLALARAYNLLLILPRPAQRPEPAGPGADA
jgi:hypothetical protein